ncbi:MAG: DJ-1/PfpI family protein, partial [Candidatus Hodarchaeota archaeon]
MSMIILVGLIQNAVYLESSIRIDSKSQIRVPMYGQASQGNPVKILFLMDNEYGENYDYIRPILEGWGWEVTLTAMSPNITPCDYQGAAPELEVDILIPDIIDITQFDCISVMPGDGHAELLASSEAHELIQAANTHSLVVSAWCRGVRVLAAADVIDGKNVTGHDDYEDEYIAAGATFFSQVPPIIDGNIVTCVRSRYYRMEMCLAIATALGVYETNPPLLVESQVAPT